MPITINANNVYGSAKQAKNPIQTPLYRPPHCAPTRLTPPHTHTQRGSGRGQQLQIMAPFQPRLQHSRVINCPFVWPPDNALNHCRRRFKEPPPAFLLSQKRNDNMPDLIIIVRLSLLSLLPLLLPFLMLFLTSCKYRRLFRQRNMTQMSLQCV